MLGSTFFLLGSSMRCFSATFGSRVWSTFRIGVRGAEVLGASGAAPGDICCFFAQHFSQYFFPFAKHTHYAQIGFPHHPQLQVHSIWCFRHRGPLVCFIGISITFSVLYWYSYALLLKSFINFVDFTILVYGNTGFNGRFQTFLTLFCLSIRSIGVFPRQ